MRVPPVVVLWALVATTVAAAPPPVEYTVHLDAPQTQMVGVTMRVPDVGDGPLEVSLPVWRPGRYRVLDPAGSVRQVGAVSEHGASLPIVKVAKSTWRVDPRGARDVVVSYRLYANELGSRTRHVDGSHAFLSGSSVFMYVPARRGLPVRVAIEAPAGWRVATGLEPLGDDPFVRTAPSYDVLVDSPLEIGVHQTLEFLLDDVPHEIVIWGDCEFDGERLIEDFRAIVDAQRSIFARMPYRRFVFLIHAGAGAGGGTEHLNSTIMQTSCAAMEGSLEADRAYKRFLGLVAHEMFHTWNVKQFRPAGLSPYDYQRENYTRLLWVAEGTTSYYDELTLVRAGFKTPGRYLEHLSELIHAHRLRPGAGVQSLEESSFDAWIKFTQPDADSVNSTVSFYSKGELASLAIDLAIRDRSGGRASMDDLVRLLFERYPRDGPGYRPEDVLALAGELAGAPMHDVFERAVQGTGPIGFESLLETVGLELRFEPSSRGEEDGEEDDAAAAAAEETGDADDPAEAVTIDGPATVPEVAYLGFDLGERNGRTVVRRVRADGPAWSAGIIADDEIIAMNGRRLRAGDLDERLERMEPGTTVTLHVMRRDTLHVYDVRLAGRADGEWAVRRKDEVSDEQRAAYEGWLGQPWDL